MQLSKSERILLDFLTEEMDDKNFISNSVQVRDKFNKLLKKMGQDTYADNTIHKCFKKLTDVELARKTRGRGTYQINPIYFFKGTEEMRQKTIREQLEELNKKPINKLRQKLIIKNAYLLPKKKCGEE